MSKTKLRRVPCPNCGGVNILKGRCDTCDGTGWTLEPSAAEKRAEEAALRGRADNIPTNERESRHSGQAVDSQQDNRALITLDLWMERNHQWARQIPREVWEDLVFALELTHNSELAAERQRAKSVEHASDVAYDILLDENEKLESDLLSAQAAIEKAKALIKAFSPDSMAAKSTGDIEDALDVVDLSLLHEHDAKVSRVAVNHYIEVYQERNIAEVRQPLVEALEQIQTHSESALTCDLPSTESMDIKGAFEQLSDIADAALDQCKEKP